MALTARQPWNERLPDGRTIAEAMAGLLAMQTGQGQKPIAQQPGSSMMSDSPAAPQPALPLVTTGQPLPAPRYLGAEAGAAGAPLPPMSPLVAPDGPITRPGPTRVVVGEQRYSGLSPLGKKMAEYRARSDAKGMETGVYNTGEDSYGVAPPRTQQQINSGGNRLKQAGIGALQGFITAAQQNRNDPWAALAGAGTGAAVGGVSPRLMEAFSRDQKLDTLRGDIGEDQAVALRSAQIGETEAQAEQRRTEPYLRAAELRRQMERDAAIDADRDTRSQQAATAEERRGKEFEERTRHNKVVEGKTTPTEEIEVAGRKFKVTPSTAARILEERGKAGAKPAPAVEASIEAQLEDEAGTDHLTKRRQADEQASKLRQERDDLSAKSLYGKDEDARKRRITDLDRQITEAERESSYRQKEADDAFSRRNKAKAKSQSTGGSAASSSGGTFNFTEWSRKYPNATPEQIEAVRQRHKGKKFI